MKWPWVSRARLEAVERELERSEAERKRFLEMLLPQKPIERVVVPAVETKEEASGPSVIPFTTAFDRIQKNTARALKDGRVPAQYKARVV